MWPAMISLILAKRGLRSIGVAYGWTAVSPARSARPGYWARRLSKFSVAATLQGRECSNNTTSEGPSRAAKRDPKIDIPNKVKIKRRESNSLTDSPPNNNPVVGASTSPPHSDQQQHWNQQHWKEHSELNPTLTFPTWAVPLKHASIIQTLLSSELTQPFLATREEVIQQCHPRPKIVQDGDGNNEEPRTHKYILLYRSSAVDQKLPSELDELLQQHNVDRNGPEISISIQYHQLPVSYILEKLLPPAVHPPPNAFETVGHVAHMNLREQHLPYAKLIGQVLLECVPAIATVIQKVGQVTGPFRTYEYELLAGRNDTTVKLQEHGIKIQFDLAKVYWCSRLAQERQVLIDEEIKAGQVVADAFCGVGAICLRAAQTKNCTILANDWNPNAVKYLKKNFESNRLRPNLAAVTNQDAYDFLMDLGFQQEPLNDEEEEEEPVVEVNPLAAHVADHVLLNFPLKASSFLGALRWWSPPLSENSPRLHVYIFARADPESGRTVDQVAVDLIASELLPAFPSSSPETCRIRELNEDFDCQVVAREVRDVAPGKLVFCVSFTATPKLLQHMQGNFID